MYAAARNLLRTGRMIEILVVYASPLPPEWWKQLYGESEGKDGKGLFPDQLIATDLHSLGQYIRKDKNFV